VKAMVERAFRDSCTRDDGLDARGAVAIVQKERGRNIEDPLAEPLGFVSRRPSAA
jgi:hypothetical protein